MRTRDGVKLKRVKSNRIKAGRYYTDKYRSIPNKWVLGEYEFTGDELTFEETKVWKVKK